MIKNKLFFKQKKVLLAICFIIYSFFNSVYAAQQLDKIAAVVGEEIITLSELSTVIGLDRNAVNYQLKKLRRIINIDRTGSDKKGIWTISKK